MGERITQTGHFQAMLDAQMAARRAVPESSWWAEQAHSREAFRRVAEDRQLAMRVSMAAKKVHTDWDGVQGGAGFAR